MILRLEIMLSAVSYEGKNMIFYEKIENLRKIILLIRYGRFLPIF